MIVVQIGGVVVQTLTSDSPDEKVQQLTEWMEKGVFEALKQGFMVCPACQRRMSRTA